MSKIIVGIQKVIGKVSGHRYTGFTVKAPFINLSFAPVLFTRLLTGPFLLDFRSYKWGPDIETYPAPSNYAWKTLI